MAANILTRNEGAASVIQPLIPIIFKGKGYELLSIRMKTLLQSQDLWNFVDTSFKKYR